MFHSRVTTDHKTLASVLIINVKCQRMVGGTQRTNEYIYVVAEMVDFLSFLLILSRYNFNDNKQF